MDRTSNRLLVDDGELLIPDVHGRLRDVRWIPPRLSAGEVASALHDVGRIRRMPDGPRLSNGERLLKMRSGAWSHPDADLDLDMDDVRLPILAAQIRTFQAVLPKAARVLTSLTFTLRDRVGHGASFMPSGGEGGELRFDRDPWAATELLHELGHALDATSYRGPGSQTGLGNDCWASMDPGDPVRELSNAAKERWVEGHGAGFLRRSAERKALAVLGPKAARAVLAGQTVPVDEAVLEIAARKQVPPRHNLIEVVREHRGEMLGPFGMQIVPKQLSRMASDLDVSMDVAQALLGPFTLLGIGVPMLRSETERRAHMNGIRRATLESRTKSYWLAPHEVFARLFDQVLRTEGLRRGLFAGIVSAPGDLDPYALAELTPAFWSLCALRGW